MCSKSELPIHICKPSSFSGNDTIILSRWRPWDPLYFLYDFHLAPSPNKSFCIISLTHAPSFCSSSHYPGSGSDSITHWTTREAGSLYIYYVCVLYIPHFLVLGTKMQNSDSIRKKRTFRCDQRYKIMWETKERKLFPSEQKLFIHFHPL